MRIAVIQFPGSNCERETMLAVKRVGMEPVEFLWNQPKEQLRDFQGYILVGGFSYEDRSRAGIIAALDPIMDVIKEQNEIRKPILGICNGAQILVEAGLVPGVEKNKLSLVLTDNKRIQQDKVLGTGFYNAWIHMRLSDNYQYNAFTRLLSPQIILTIPVAHAEGRFVIPPALLLEMQENGLNVFQYCDEKGNIIDAFPINPNGSINNIAAISNKAGNVMAMMPHPERTPVGDSIFASMKEYIAEGDHPAVPPLYYYPRPSEIKKYIKRNSELIVHFIITDNHILSVETALRHKNIKVKLKRFFHWEVDCQTSETLEKIKTSPVIFNNNKERLVDQIDRKNKKFFLIRPKEDMLGLQKKQMLKDHFDLSVNGLLYGVLWQIEGSPVDIDYVIHSSILFNPYAHDCYEY